ncbi:MAG: hypothetical protein AAF490_31705 [Chloroflexota bacterium]
MTNKNFANAQQETARPFNRSLATILLIGLAALLSTLFLLNPSTQTTSTVQANPNEAMATYGNGMTQQYTQSWLEQTASQISGPEYNNTLPMEYAQPWLEQTTFSVNELGNGLSMQYAQKWLDAISETACNGRLDEIYACQNSSR